MRLRCWVRSGLWERFNGCCCVWLVHTKILREKLLYCANSLLTHNCLSWSPMTDIMFLWFVWSFGGFCCLQLGLRRRKGMQALCQLRFLCLGLQGASLKTVLLESGLLFFFWDLDCCYRKPLCSDLAVNGIPVCHCRLSCSFPWLASAYFSWCVFFNLIWITCFMEKPPKPYTPSF